LNPQLGEAVGDAFQEAGERWVFGFELASGVGDAGRQALVAGARLRGLGLRKGRLDVARGGRQQLASGRVQVGRVLQLAFKFQNRRTQFFQTVGH
ncbi:MAG TPA: hypothetical protein PLV92_29840, partial [Pirellulaceae bacterium]|nr:hypothetical protein [Pirellulaceae bacterium]